MKHGTLKVLLAVMGLVIGGPALSETKEMIASEDLKADFQSLYAGLKSAHYDLYIHRSHAEYDARFNATIKSFDKPLSLFEAQVEFQKFVAFGKVAHARIDLPNQSYSAFRAEGGRSFPVYPRIVDGRLFVGESYAPQSLVNPGDEIIAINGRPVREWIDRTSQYVSADTQYMVESLLEFRFPYLLWLEAGEIEKFKLIIKSPGKKRRTVRISGTTLKEQEAAAANITNAFVFNGDTREAHMLDAHTAYLKPGPFFNIYNFNDPQAMWDNQEFIEFVDNAFTDFIKKGATTLLIDLRENSGGDNSFSDPMISWVADRPFRFISSFRVKSSPEAEAANQRRLDSGALSGPSAMFAEQYEVTPYGEVFEISLPDTQPRQLPRFEGKVFVLINRHTYSNAVNVASIFQDYGFGTVIGEKTSDLATTYGAMETFRLPRTGIEVGFPKAHLIRPSGEEKADGVTPDISISSPIGLITEDVVLKSALNVMRQEEASTEE